MKRGNAWSDESWEKLAQLRDQIRPAVDPAKQKPRLSRKHRVLPTPKRNLVRSSDIPRPPKASSSGCPICKAKIPDSAMQEHYERVHPVELNRTLELDRLKQRAERVRPTIFLGGSPGSGKKR